MMADKTLVRRPIVAQPPKPMPVVALAATLTMTGLGVFFWLSSARAAMEDQGSALPALVTSESTAPQDAPAEARQAQSGPEVAPSIDISGGGPVMLQPSAAPRVAATPSPYASVFAPVTAADPAPRIADKTLIIDLAQAEVRRSAGQAVVVRDEAGRDQRGETIVTGNEGETVAAAPTVDRSLSDTEQFVSRVGNEQAQVAVARRMGNLDLMIPQGAIIGAVMETALNSDQPGYARALTSRDVYSFDGSTVLIPAGSRVIGQYKSGVAQGASRLFVLWTRLIRPDGVSIDLGSPAVDDLGRGGLGGKVNRHFLQRFGGAILTSVLTGGLSALASRRSGGSTVIVNSAGQASTLAAQAGRVGDIPPTITTRQGAAVRIFVARDLDFTRVGPAR